MRDKLLTWEQYWKLMFGVACIVILVLSAGCASSPKEVRRLNVESTVLVLACQERVQEEWDKRPANKRMDVKGFYDPFLNEIWVTENEDGMPDFATLGHEIWHQAQLGGEFHK